MGLPGYSVFRWDVREYHSDQERILIAGKREKVCRVRVHESQSGKLLHAFGPAGNKRSPPIRPLEDLHYGRRSDSKIRNTMRSLAAEDFVPG